MKLRMRIGGAKVGMRGRMRCWLEDVIASAK
jgi:hypothetical protein